MTGFVDGVGVGGKGDFHATCNALSKKGYVRCVGVKVYLSGYFIFGKCLG